MALRPCPTCEKKRPESDFLASKDKRCKSCRAKWWREYNIKRGKYKGVKGRFRQGRQCLLCGVYAGAHTLVKWSRSDPAICKLCEIDLVGKGRSRCRKCNTAKPIMEFSSYQKRKWCFGCANKARREYYAKNKERLAVQRAEKMRDPEYRNALRAYDRQYYKMGKKKARHRDPEKRRAYFREYRKRKKEQAA